MADVLRTLRDTGPVLWRDLIGAAALGVIVFGALHLVPVA